MKLALCYQNVQPERGGCETYIVDLARRLVADGHEVHLYANRWNAAVLPAALHCHFIPMPPCPRFRRPWLFGEACLRTLRRAAHDVSVGFDKTWGQDVLYPQGGLHLANADHRVLIQPQGTRRLLAQARIWMDLGYWSFARLERRQYLGTRRPLIVVNSNMVGRHFQKYYGVEPGSLRLVPNAINSGRFADPDARRRWLEARRRWHIEANAVVGLFAAMNYPLKGLDPLLRAVRLLPPELPFLLAVAGNPRTGTYRRLARRLRIADRVRFLGPCADMRDCYFAADFLIHPTFYDPCSLVVLEALACGLPVITSVHNGASELLNPPADGLLIEDPHDHSQLARAIETLADPTTRWACAAQARRTAARWDFEEHYRRLLAVFHEAAARKQAA
jgi:UDP-glucose:(heptosyl)LPS alpha-1,3-glucosyltransferase